MRYLLDWRWARVLLTAIFFSFSAVTGVCQEPPPPKPKSSGLFDGLKKLLPDDPKALREKFDSTLKSGTDGLKSLVDSVSLPKDKVDALLSYLDQKLAGRESSFTSEQIENNARKLVPLVEELAQRKFSTPPQIKTVGTLQLVNALAQDLVPQFEKMFPEMSKPLIYLRAYLSAGLVSPNLLGKYSPTTRAVYVVPMNLEAILQEKGISGEYREQILQIVIGHELVHALQDQEVNLQRTTLATDSVDAATALNALIEGHAVFTQNALASKLKFQEAARKASELFLVEDLKEDAWVYERIAHVRGVLNEQIYMGGGRFVAYHYGRGGMPAVWNILAHPPQRSSMITQPETYTTTRLPNPDYKARFASLQTNAGLTNDWALDAVGVGDFQLRGMIADVDRTTRERLMQGLSEAVFVEIAHKKELTRGIEIALFKFKAEAEAITMVDTEEKMTLQDFKDLERNPRVRLRDNVKQPYSLGPGSTGDTWHYSVEAFLLGKNDFTRIVARRGETVISVLESGSGLTPPQLAKLLGECVEKMKP